MPVVYDNIILGARNWLCAVSMVNCSHDSHLNFIK